MSESEERPEATRRLMSSMKRSLVSANHQLASMFEELEGLMMNFENKHNVLRLRGHIIATFTQMKETHDEYIDHLPEGEEKSKALMDIGKQTEGKDDIIKHVELWLRRCQESQDSLGNLNAPNRSNASRSQCSVNSVSSSKRAELNRCMAELKLKQLKRKQEQARIEREIADNARERERQLADRALLREAQDVLEQAQLQEQIIGTNDVFAPDSNTRNDSLQFRTTEPQTYEPIPGFMWMPNLQNNHETNAPHLENVRPGVSSRATRTIPPENRNDQRSFFDVDKLVDGLAHAVNPDVPRVEMDKFGGELRKYCKFIHVFKSQIHDNQRLSDSQKLTQLTNVCVGKALEEIEECVMLPNGKGYPRALEILDEKFGQPHNLKQSYLNSLLNGPHIKANDGDGLSDLAMEMRKAHLALSSLGYATELNNSDTILTIMHRLTPDLQRKWASKAQAIIISKREPTFTDFSNFVEDCALISSNFYGKNVKGANRSSLTNVPRRFNTLATVNQSVGSCLYCDDPHDVSECEGFKGLHVDDRFEFLRDKGVCYNCLQVGHLAIGCLSTNMCEVSGCHGKHHALLHRRNYYKANNNSTETSRSANVNSVQVATKVCLRVVPVRVKAGGNEVLAYALLDSGSDVSLVSNDLMRKLNVSGTSTTFKVNTVNNERTVHGSHLSLVVSSLDNTESIKINNAYEVSKLPVTSDNIPSVQDIDKWPHLKDVTFPSLDVDSVDILIGSDVPEAFWVVEQRIGDRKDPYAVKSILGWSLIGAMDKNAIGNGSYAVNNISLKDVTLESQISRLWDTDFADLKDVERSEMSYNDMKALNIVSSSLKHNGERFECSMPWKIDPVNLCNNFGLAKHRLRSLKRRLSSNDNLRKGYCKTFDMYINDGHASKADRRHVAENFSDLWFLPHHPVCNPNKSKVRVVFDCAAIYGNKSLNEFLYSGPDYTSSLLGVLMRFRNEKIALTGDVENMFHQVLVDKKSRDKLCFLWWTDGNLENPPEVYQMNVHLFGASSSPFCANFCLRATVEHFSEPVNPNALNAIHKSFYVDDCLVSCPDEITAINLRKDISRVLKGGGFHIRKWVSNSRKVLQTIPKSDLSPSLNELSLNLDELPTDKTLGLNWNVESDSFRFKTDYTSQPCTRRGLLSIVSSIFDPLGFASPFCLKAKLLLQEVVRSKYGWDDPIEPRLCKMWNLWLTQLPYLGAVNVPRCIKINHSSVTESQLHYFCDASNVGYGAVCYLRNVYENGHIGCSFIYGKSRLVPIKRVTIPRLELTSAVLAVNMHELVNMQHNIEFDKVWFWTDSTTVVQYIHNDHKRFKTFVANRLNKIRKSTTAAQWRHIVGDQNPADEASRGIHGSSLTSHSRWLTGPEFLTKHENEWPRSIVSTVLPDSDEEVEARSSKILCVVTCVKPLDKMVSYYSSWLRLVHALCFWLRFKQFLKSRLKYRELFPDTFLSISEIEIAEHYLIQYLQARDLGEVMLKLQKGLDCGRDPILKKFMKCSPILQNGVLRVGGRLGNAPIDYDKMHPIILPKGHFSNLIIKMYHDQNGHVGPGHTWSLIREKYWILNGGVEVRKYLKSCIYCRQRNAKSGEQLMADLPACRVTPDQPPFTSVGVDYFGPILVRQKRSQVKRFGCIFSCFVTRAVHIEIAYSLTASSFINAFRRFCSRRGFPKLIFSDNGTNFVGAERELRNAMNNWDQRDIAPYMLQHRIEWRFNPPKASHMGGVWERMIRTIRRLMGSLIGKLVVDDEGLVTIMTEIEGIINSRPLIPLSYDPGDDEPLTPNHLLLFRANPNIPPGIFTPADQYATRRWRQMQYVVDKFWYRWKIEYLPLLLPRSKWLKVKRNLAINDTVLLSGDVRGQWCLGRIVNVFPDKHGLVRTAEVKTARGVYVRPLTKIHLMESA